MEALARSPQTWMRLLRLDLLRGDCLAIASTPQWVDFVPLGLSKATALRVVLDCLGIDPADVVVFGDGSNDREVFELVGCPVAVAHADPGIIQKARYVTDTVEWSLSSILDGSGYVDSPHMGGTCCSRLVSNTK